MKKVILPLLVACLFVACNKDKEAPVITLSGGDLELSLGIPYVEPGAVAQDAVDGVVPVISTHNINTMLVGSYTVNYTAKDAAGNEATATRTVKYNSFLLAGGYESGLYSEITVSFFNSQYNKLYFSMLKSGNDSENLYNPFYDVGVVIDKNTFTPDREYTIDYYIYGTQHEIATLLQEPGEITYNEGLYGRWRIRKLIYKVKIYNESTQRERIETVAYNFYNY